MGFLSGVLEAVKDENEVTTYDKYIQPESKRLQNVLDTLNKNIGSGRTGLVDSVGAVKRWLEGYESKLGEKTENIKNELTTLINDLERKHKMSINPNDKLEIQLHTWKTVLHKIDEHVTNAETTHISWLDRNLENEMMSEIKPIKMAVRMLHESSTNEMLTRQVKNVDKALEEEEKTITQLINIETGKVRDELQTQFENIRGSVASLENRKMVHFEFVKSRTLKRWKKWRR
ncbi:hypothetical protein, conserved [Babesia bigemina]|uniref:Uncharacterized protein n=1 Tax=Babesia bigemina TaxID=5866 RepID=A0A061BK95_BABBI|nr:hypothetical protein, conserved [Babesia bigemina]CDR71900.1 hypothetical protein, conserved [Babesia bigemina]|eukprot:XP_012770842.1 hypothetical protein, conserved [Babesia bigemina]